MSRIFKFQQGKIKSIKNLGLIENEMYDIGMKDTPHTFFANNILVHNSVFFPVDPITETNLEEISTEAAAAESVKQATEVQNYINKAYDFYALKLHNCKNHYFKIKQEVVARRAFWGTVKKRYAQWLVFEEGVPVNKLDVKGLDVVRSNFPKMFREFMEQMLIDILNDKSKDYVEDKLIELKNHLNKLDVTDILVPTSVKELSKFDVKRDLFKFNKGTPAHCKAALAYNDFLELKELHSYRKIQNGDKILWVYLSENPYALDSIGIPDEDDIPDEVINLMKTYTDKNKLFDNLLIGKVKTFFEVLNWGDIVLTKNQNAFF